MNIEPITITREIVIDKAFVDTLNTLQLLELSQLINVTLINRLHPQPIALNNHIHDGTDSILFKTRVHMDGPTYIHARSNHKDLIAANKISDNAVISRDIYITELNVNICGFIVGVMVHNNPCAGFVGRTGSDVLCLHFDLGQSNITVDGVKLTGVIGGVYRPITGEISIEYHKLLVTEQNGIEVISVELESRYIEFTKC